MHVREAAPEAAVLKLGDDAIRCRSSRSAASPKSVERCVVIEEGDPYLFEQIRAAGISVEQKPEMYRFGELNVARVRRILAGDVSPEPAPPPGKPPQLCAGCPHRMRVRRAARSSTASWRATSAATRSARCRRSRRWIRCVCMGASIGVGLGLRHVLPPERGPARGQRHRRQHVRAQRHHRAGRDGLQPAGDRPRRADSRQRHHGHDRPAGASRAPAARSTTSRPGKVVH